MRVIRLCSLVAALGAVTMVLASCGGPSIPYWVEQGAGAFDGSGKQVFYGVGAVNGVRNKPLARTSAENRARAQIAKQFETYTASLMKDYAASITAGAAVGAESDTREEQMIEQTIKTFSAVTLSGVKIINHWTNPSNGTVYALARLDLEDFKNNLDKMKELSAGVRDFVRKNANKAFDSLAAEEEKRGG